jgi:hypothetical protein
MFRRSILATALSAAMLMTAAPAALAAPAAESGGVIGLVPVVTDATTKALNGATTEIVHGVTEFIPG